MPPKPEDSILSILVPCGSAAACRLVCFPWSGGGTAVYGRWGRCLPDCVEVTAIRLKGRESRFSEAVYDTKEQVIEDIVKALLQHDYFKSSKVAFFGHSLGSILAVETALYLKNNHNLDIDHLFVSGASAPNSDRFKEYLKTRNYSKWSDADLKAFLIKQGGTPKEVLDNEEFFHIHTKALRADLNLIENYKFTYDLTYQQLSCPITCFDGDKDVPHDQDSFAHLTVSKRFSKISLPGGHFYLLEDKNRDFIINCINHLYDGCDEIL